MSLLCDNKTTSCSDNCTFWDCKDFKPADYFMSGIKGMVKTIRYLRESRLEAGNNES
ncbi:hypothetical protein LCGC14_1573010 [marine sediment metagenome]|uniref:Uncharacterized protein n=1 Tax=marine sediment metagenome TaxID=412755 RepID=A0A0F9L0B2_9ZZZZ